MGRGANRRVLVRALGASFAAALALALASAAPADDFKLKDGSKISGTIVGFDDNSFKVQTSYGFAVVRKDQVVSISVGDPAAKPADKAAKANAPADAASAKNDPDSVSADAKPSATPAAPAASAPTPAVAAAAVPPPPPAPPPPPEPIKESVSGNLYTNETYAFRMYKPPSWHVIADAQTLMPGAIAAMGNLDETTYLLVGKEPAGKTVANDIEATDRRLHGMLENFRPLGESQVSVSGIQATEQKFRGSVEQKDWSGTVVFVERGGQLYTIFGMTLADTDLVQIQENVIARSITSLQFAQ